MAGIRYREDKKTWIIDYFDNQGKRHQVKAGRIKGEAEEIFKKIMNDLHKEKIEGVNKIEDKPFSEFVTEYKKYAEANKKKKTYDAEKYTCELLSKHFGNKRLSEITVKDLQQYKDKLSIEKAEGTVNRWFALLKGMFSKAIDWGYAKENPVKKIKLFKLNNAVIRYLDPNEYKALLTHCDKSIKPFVMLALHTGLRKDELATLTWNDVNIEKRTIHIRQSKNGEGRFVPINATAKTVLEELAQVRRIDSQDIFHDLTNFRRLWEKALKHASITDFRFHDCRHTFASYAVMSGMDLRTLQDILGHKTILMTLRYSHLSQQHKMAAVQKMDQYLNNPDKSIEASG